jgi:DNA-directed RNA polymerase sigma subunit (sigma70/sigma32)
MQRAAALRAQADQLVAEADELVRKAMVKASKPHTLGDIAHVSGLSRSRVHQIVKGRSDRR